MFTGIIEEVGQISDIVKNNDITSFTILAPKTASKSSLGDSIAIDGTCLTVRGIAGEKFTVDAIGETLSRTICGGYQTGTKVNLETALTLEKGIHGHLVQGHIDGTGTLVEHNDKNELRFTFPPKLAHFLAFKGSVTINGVSLTISGLEDKNFKVSLIPFTLENTNLGELKNGDMVNLEIDLIARYIERMVHEKEGESKYHFLKERNLI